MTEIEERAEKIAAEGRVTAAVAYLAPDAKPAHESSALWVYGIALVSSALLYIGTRFKIPITQEIAASGAAFVLTAAIALFGWIRRKKRPVEVPIAGSEAAKPGS